MDSYDFDTQPTLARDRIYVSWNEHWDLRQYAEAYLKERNLVADEQARELVLRHIASCPRQGALRKADVDYYLDVNAKPALRVAEAPAKVGKKLIR